MSGIHLSADNYLLQKMIPAACIKRVVDLDKIDWETPFDPKNFDFSEQNEDQYGARSIYHETYITRQEGDIIVYYNDLGPLSGSAGYILFRDGYVYSSRITRRA